MYDDDWFLRLVDGLGGEFITAEVGAVAKIFDIEKLGFSYPDQEILKDISLTISCAQSVVLLGPSGVGKSTLLRLIAGLLPVTEGEINFSPHPDGVGARLVFQEPRLLPWLSVRKNLYFALRAAGVPKGEWDTRIYPLLQEVGLADTIDSSVHALSVGMAQRIALVRALLCQPQVLLLDEPFSALDPKRKSQLQAEVRQLQKRINIAVVMVTHDLDEAIRMADQIVVLKGRPARIIARFECSSWSPQSLYAALVDALQ